MKEDFLPGEGGRSANNDSSAIDNLGDRGEGKAWDSTTLPHSHSVLYISYLCLVMRMREWSF